MSDSFGDSSTEYMPEGVGEHIPVICVEVHEVDYTTFADKERNAFSACLIIVTKLKHFKLICLKLLLFCLLVP